MNPRQRRGLLLLLLGIVVAAVTFFAVSSYVAQVNSQVGPKVTVYRAGKAIDPYTPLGPENLVAVEVPRRWTTESSRATLEELTGRRIGFPLVEGTTISKDMLLAPSSLEPDEREIAINVDAVTGVAGRVRPGDKVDIYAVYEKEKAGKSRDQVVVLVRDVRVVTIRGQQTVVRNEGEGDQAKEVIPVTLALVPDDALKVTYAYNFAKEVRLVGLPTDMGTRRASERDEYDGTAGNAPATPTKPRTPSTAKATP